MRTKLRCAYSTSGDAKSYAVTPCRNARTRSGTDTCRMHALVLYMGSGPTVPTILTTVTVSTRINYCWIRMPENCKGSCVGQTHCLAIAPGTPRQTLALIVGIALLACQNRSLRMMVSTGQGRPHHASHG